MLIVADIHFGKAAAFRAQGIPVPRGTTAQNLAMLDLLLARYSVATIAFLGDFLHARRGRSPATLAAIQQWRDRHPTLELLLVRGNHDHHAGDPPASLRIEVVDAPYHVDGLALCHHPDPIPNTYVLAGHVHPVFRLGGRGGSLRLPCFVVGADHCVLPSFGAFTGGYAVDALAEQRIFVVTDDAVHAVPGRAGETH